MLQKFKKKFRPAVESGFSGYTLKAENAARCASPDFVPVSPNQES
jgi:hypothetical protein